ncbi:hypothetical protein EI555_004097, partial [Monodon monoceros]
SAQWRVRELTREQCPVAPPGLGARRHFVGFSETPEPPPPPTPHGASCQDGDAVHRTPAPGGHTAGDPLTRAVWEGDQVAAEDAIHNKLHRVNITLHIGNISPTCTNQELWARLEEHGAVIECDIMKDYAFVHVERAEDAVGLTEFQGTRTYVQLSTSQLRTAPGIGHQSGSCQCGKEGHWSEECPVDRTGSVEDFTEHCNKQYGAACTADTVGYGESVCNDA